jgi:hypothetical protein
VRASTPRSLAHDLALSAAPLAPDLAWAFCGQVSWRDWTVGAIFTHASGGEILMLTPGENWAEHRVRKEYSRPDLAHPYGYFHTEGYYMEIEGLTGL